MFNGRIGVADYWKAVLVFVIILLVVGIGGGVIFLFIGSALLKTLPITGIGGIFAALFGVFIFAAIPMVVMSIVGLVWSVGLQIRRLHDLGLSGWIVLGLWIINGIIFIFGRTGTGTGLAIYAPWALAMMAIFGIIGLGIMLWPGKPEPNSYGAPVAYRSWWAALMGDKNPSPSGNKTVWIVGLVVVVLLVIAVGAVWGLAGQGNSTTAAPVSTNPSLASGVFVTPNGTPMLQPPAGWQGRVNSDSPNNTYALFEDGQGAVIGFTIDQRKDGLSPQAFLEKDFANWGGTPAPVLVSEGPVTINGVTGYMLEGTAQSYIVVGQNASQGLVHKRIYDFALNGKDYYISVSTPDTDWTKDLPLIEAAVATAQIK